MNLWGELFCPLHGLTSPFGQALAAGLALWGAKLAAKIAGAIRRRSKP